jgi:hypothetical protein
MPIRLIIASLIIIVTIAIHTGAMLLAVKVAKRKVSRWKRRIGMENIYGIVSVVLIMFLASILEVWVWAATYLALNAIEGAERAFYFSMVTYTTLGYGDVVLDEQWRILGGFEAANGIIMFGWTTAMVIIVVQRKYFANDSD